VVRHDSGKRQARRREQLAVAARDIEAILDILDAGAYAGAPGFEYRPQGASDRRAVRTSQTLSHQGATAPERPDRTRGCLTHRSDLVQQRPTKSGGEGREHAI
jgi:hypothetical protein